MRHPFSIYLRTYRKKFGLTQSEAAELIGMETGQIVSRHENTARMPTLRTAVAYQIVFDVPLRALFPHLYRTVEAEVLARASALLSEISALKQSQRTAHKLRRLEELIRSIQATDDV